MLEEETAQLSSSSRVVMSSLSADEELLTVLPRHTKVVITGNNRTKSVLVGLQGVVKKAVGLGGWHWLVLKNGVEVKLQRNALSVLEHPTGNEDDNSSNSSDLVEKDNNNFSRNIEFHKLTRPRMRHTWVHPSSKSMHDGSNYRQVQSNIRVLQLRVNLGKLGTSSLWRYCRRYKLRNITHDSSKEEMVKAVQRHFATQQLDEIQVIVGFIRAAKRRQKHDSIRN